MERKSHILIPTLRRALANDDQLTQRPIDLHAYANDASHFLLTPQAVAIPNNAAEVGALLKASAEVNLPLTFRSGGTSLSGQGVTDSLLVDVRKNFKDIDVLDNGARVRVQPGVTVRALNARLALYGRKFGPDPASEAACTIGGVVANNSSGMHCGTVDNVYRTLESVVIVLTSGTVIDTGAPDANEKLRALEPAVFAGLEALTKRVRSNAESVATIKHQFSMKNTMGYGLNSFLDYEDPAQVLAHLIIGSEGTLGFVAEATFRTVPAYKHVTTSLMVFDDLFTANESLEALVGSGAATVELMDSLSLKVGQTLQGAPQIITDLNVHSHAAFLVEYTASSAEELADRQATGMSLANSLKLSAPAQFSPDTKTRTQLWKLRKGLYASVAGARAQGTTALLEDIVVPVPALARTCAELSVLFDRYEYENSVIFGHAKDGNVHFMLTDGFHTSEQLGRYSAFTEDMVELVLGEGGSLKAEHGTGRVMAPYVRRQYGDELYDVMRELKMLLDPAGLLNPGVILDEDPKAHLRHIKVTPAVDPEVDRCVACGYCEPVCPSRNLTLTPRQRIVTLRAIETARLAGDTKLAAELEKDYSYESVDTCAVDGMCQTACPVDINTGTLVKKLRAKNVNTVEGSVWDAAAQHWSAVTRGAGKLLGVADKVPLPLVLGANKAGRAVLGADVLPLYSPELPAGGRQRARPAPAQEPVAVYFPACVNTMFGPADPRQEGIQESFGALARRTGVELLVPEGIDSLCCGTPWSSKGMEKGRASMGELTISALRAASRNGKLPILCDASSCTEGLRHAIEEEVPPAGGLPLRIMDVVEYTAEHILPLLPAGKKVASLALHPTCSSTRMGLNPALQTVAEAVADTIQIPENWGCCGFAGDRGMLHPELTASATEVQAAEVRAFGATTHASCNRTCELGMTRATDHPYEHVLELLERTTRP
ncbi:FAD-binding and (Fe-S)-binding domain-containing protein [Paeniglutamicibacter sulfureus]|uniref:FAD-binding and (Fe-S)-binding domain-containing protein n=1 Tax=Paeniglutamicibacter sulfureus TaxID=43666 RepID=UPI00266654C3|nr:FAD-binding and (Fe-S)-binding domain-containing protein [Paeniglutamicibacter sulfureus]MDO2934585.1 FAD-binding and (Fe-S)-binding domain-containing protein [Paeniglutamicibacter sulfureus]